MGVVASLEPPTVVVEPEAAASGELHVRNSGESSEEVSFHVAGDGAAWVSVFPRSVRLEPGASSTARLVVKMPPSLDPGVRSAPFEVRVVSASDGGVAAVAGGVVEVAPSPVVGAALVPRNSRARRSAEHVVRLENRGTAPVTVTVRAADPSGLLRFHVDPSPVSVEPGGVASVRLEARAARPLLMGAKGRVCPFDVLVEPEGGAPVSVEGTLHQQPAVPRGAPLALAGALVLALAGVGLSGAIDSSDGGRPTSTTQAGPTTTTIPREQHGGSSGHAAPPGCPTSGHGDPKPLNHNTTAEDLRLLPRDYSFMRPADNPCFPARFNPCEPVHYVLNPTLAPPGGVSDARAAIAQLSRATGIQFIEDGVTDEVIRGAVRQAYQPERYGNRWAPVLIVWERFGAPQNAPQAAGRGGPYVVQPGVIVTGAVGLNVDAVTDLTTREKIRDGFDAGRLTVGEIGPLGVTWGRVLLHELAHLVGLGHVSDRSQIMYPEASQHTTRTAAYGTGDQAGLRVLGRQSGCVTTPPPVAARPAG